MSAKNPGFGPGCRWPAGNQNGQSLIQVLISIGLFGIFAAGFAAMVGNQARSLRALSEKSAAFDLQQLLTSSLADGSVCQYVLNNPNVLTFDSTTVSPATPQTINLTNPTADTAALYLKLLPNPSAPPALIPGPTIVQVDKPASPLSNSLIVQSIQLQITAGGGGSYLGNWLINFDSSKTVHTLKPVSVSTSLTVDTTTPSAAKIIGCGSSASSGGMGCAIGQEIQQGVLMRDPRDPSAVGFAMNMTSSFAQIASGSWVGVTKDANLVGWSGVNGPSTSPFWNSFWPQTSYKYEGVCTGNWKLVGWSLPWGYGGNFSHYTMTWRRVN